MKKLLITIIALVGLVAFSGCSKDDKENDYSLDGTVWKNETDGIKTIKFALRTFTFDYVYQNGTYHEEDHDNGTYVYNPPFIHFTAINRETNKTETQSGRIDGNKLIFGELVYTKQ
ncbi:hypothetical protein HQ45_06845 [Porphyromonas crevioricanis]|uniref:hypothetical protein n=1 Tax=Porphyromonas crevioricanis TaxID=393921 RepID=UPI00052B6209|nr:hypothetical protein [Porphyromonas crevioricanis]KGN89697.1 hypothetical protein HQ45_06845 [Porphyromonas crevioricanis]